MSHKLGICIPYRNRKHHLDQLVPRLTAHLNKQGIEEAKKLPPAKSHELIEQKLLYLEDMMDKLTKDHDKRLDNIEDKIYRR